MEGLKFFHLLALLSTFSVILVNGQISTPCSTAMISTVTPCLNFITGSSANGATTPTKDCCDSLKSLMTTSMDCTCLVVTANVPVQLPINRTLSLSLPSACNTGVPIQCKATGTPLPAPGPAALGAPPLPLAPLAASPLSPRASKAFAPAPSDETSLTSPPPAPSDETSLTPPPPAPSDETSLTPPTEESEAPSPITSAGIRPVLTPPAPASHSSYTSPPATLMLFVGIMISNIF